MANRAEACRAMTGCASTAPTSRRRCGARRRRTSRHRPNVTPAPFLERELALLRQARVAVVLGRFAYQAMASHLGVRPRPAFGHGVVVPTDTLTMVCSYHVSQQNTFTGKLTEPMLDAVFATAVELASP
ncbi:MAG: hypothetical protein R2699_18130 [Acidimicrobiales bacterium]